MEFAGRIMELATKALNNSTVHNVVLVSGFGLLSLRSVHQQKLIEALETQKQTLLNSNKSIKKTLWDSKQQLYSEASCSKTAIIPLDTLKQIYNDAPSADTGKGVGKSAPSKILI